MIRFVFCVVCFAFELVNGWGERRREGGGGRGGPAWVKRLFESARRVLCLVFE